MEDSYPLSTKLEIKKKVFIYQLKSIKEKRTPLNSIDVEYHNDFLSF